MKTPIQAFKHFIENDRMQKIYTKKQILEVIDLLLMDREKEHIIDAYCDGVDEGYQLAKIDDIEENCTIKNGNEYYNTKYEI